ncbi:hypothetical protein PSHT_08375 [Puccinia striiformis]|uniref:ATP-dependent DNA helicase n=1 Tax=Puccinia striiformis TaxID=27350 RepID=A0A2S4VPG1_9BASI|nr:hypothetical protein PSHT_08375 [Puccinia striiformis]
MAIKQKHYAVRVGREGPKIYDNWKETERVTRNYPYAQHKSFTTLELAQKYLDEHDTRTKLNESQILKRVRNQHHQNLLTQEDEEEEIPSENFIKKKQKTDTPSSTEPTQTPQSTSIPSSFVDKKPILNRRSTSVRPIVHSQQPDLDDLSEDQTKVFKAVIAGGSVFFTGSAGTGKSHLLKKIIHHFRTRTRKEIHVTASTGIAASLIKGTTPILSLAWVSLMILRINCTSKSWLMNSLLKVSMIDGEFFDKLNQLAKRFRCNIDPFGGIQLILTGDFFQLPPVTKPGLHVKRLPYLFESESWEECVDKIIVLKHVFRQSDQVFVDLLNEIRVGLVSPQTKEIMASLTKPVKYDDGIVPTELKVDVAQANQFHWKNLNQPEKVFECQDSRTTSCTISLSELSRNLDRNTLASHKLILKLGAQVMLIKNIRDQKLVNGSVGIVIGFETDRNSNPLNDDDQHDLQTSKKSKTGINDYFEPINTDSNQVKLWPKVKFTSGQTILLIPHEFEHENSQGEVIGVRQQVPLILAWALSIHKSQGQSLDRVKIDLGRAFGSYTFLPSLSILR